MPSALAVGRLMTSSNLVDCNDIEGEQKQQSPTLS
jgi:hypothetical protein